MNAQAVTLPPHRWAADLGATALLLLAALAGFWPSFEGGARFLVAVLGGLTLGLGIAAVAARRRWGILTVTGLTLAAYFLFGGAFALGHTAIAGAIPTLETLRQLAIGVVTSWKSLLTTVAPVAASDGHLLVPFLLALVASVMTASFALRLRQPAWALLPSAATLLFVIAMGVPQPAWPVAQGMLFAGVTIVWLALRQRWAPQNSAVSVGAVDAKRAAQQRWRRGVSAAVVLTVAGGLGVAASAVTAPDAPRQIFRDVIIPPFDIREFPSPLQSFRKYVRDDVDQALFTVRGLPEGARIRIGVMDQYNGVVYNVTDGGQGTSSAFTPLRANMSPDAEGVAVTLQVQIDEYSAVWLPAAGAVQEIVFEGERAEELRRTTVYNDVTGTAVARPGLRAGDSYTVHTVLPADLTDEELAEAEFGKVRMPRQTNVPDGLSAIAADAVAEAETPLGQVRALEAFLSEGGFFSHGLENQPFSRPGHGTERITTLVGSEQMVGDDEQYAALMALMLRELGIPARVVMGFYPDEGELAAGAFTATGDAVHAWVEVNFAGHGWRAFDPTPPEEQVPSDQHNKPKADPRPQVLQPPPPPQEPADLPPLIPDERESEDEKEQVSPVLGMILAIGGISLGVLALLAAPFILIGAWKASRRRARRAAERTADRISGGWDELTDRAIDYGARLTPGATRVEEGVAVAESLTAPAALTLAARADTDVFGPGEPTPEDVAAFWHEVDEIVGGIGKRAGLWRRLRARLSLRALLGDSALARGVQGLKDAARNRKADTGASAAKGSENS